MLKHGSGHPFILYSNEEYALASSHRCFRQCSTLIVMKKPKLGQHFLVDEAAQQAIVEALGDVSTRTVIEIGPGHGAITSILAARCQRLIAIEIDAALAAELRFRVREQAHVEIVESDVLEVNLAALIQPGERADVVGNLPYYITSPI